MDASSASAKRVGYNERIFATNMRGWFHLSRFRWIARATARDADLRRVIELGCFDGRLLEYLPRQPERYLGVDADWEGGLSAARARFRGQTNREFIKATDPSVLAAQPAKSFSSAFSLETLEHVPPDVVGPYLAELARVLDGKLYITVPNEKGPIFLAKWCLKSLLYGDGEQYRFGEIVAATFGQMRHVARNQHKGFDYHQLAAEVAKHFDDVRLHGLPGGLIPFFSMTVAITAKSRATPCVA